MAQSSVGMPKRLSAWRDRATSDPGQETGIAPSFVQFPLSAFQPPAGKTYGVSVSRFGSTFSTHNPLLMSGTYMMPFFTTTPQVKVARGR